MKFSIGLKPCADTELVDAIIRNKNSIFEVYFSYGDFANGRSIVKAEGMSDFTARLKQESDLEALSRNGIKLNVLFNAVCYGKYSLSRAFFEKIGNTLEHLIQNYGVSGVTTTSPLIARFVKENFNGIETRASVNMCIGSTEGMEYISEHFDGFYLKRELNHDFKTIEKLKKWCDENGKTLYALANSGCLNNCSAHFFHDSLVAHEEEIAAMDNGYEFRGVCRDFLEKKGAAAFISHTSFIRPEDVKYYEGIFPMLKLATRASRRPVRTLNAYINEKYVGNVAELCEPDHSGVLYPYIIENTKLNSRISNSVLIYDDIENAVAELK
ncbi:MAG: hypothetical protein E7588_06735 [Ruminococcaceae bacterium]|nr:hypothetical protein [Oscillospiraceae bacterium]